jgi:hypothetical protein
MSLSGAQRRLILKAVSSAGLSKDEQGRLCAWIEHLSTEYLRAPKGARDTKAARRELKSLHGYASKLLDVLDWQRAWKRTAGGDGPLSKDVRTATAVHSALIAAMGGGTAAKAEVRRIVQALEMLEGGLIAAHPAATEGRPPGKRELICRLAALLREIGITPTHRQNEPLLVILSALDPHADSKDLSRDIKRALDA